MTQIARTARIFDTGPAGFDMPQPVANPDVAGHGHNGSVAPLVRSPLPSLPFDVAVADLDELLSAVNARLRYTVGGQSRGAGESAGPDKAAHVRAGVLECVEALDQLQITLAHELIRREHLELEVFDAHAALALARTELAGTRAGERWARHQALHDSLTSLPNRGFFRERLDQAMADSEPHRQALAVLYIDLDGFKPVNDTHGHDAGDQLLRIVAARLTRAVRVGDMVSRIRGDEFACLLSGLPSEESLSSVARKLFQAVSAPFRIGESRLMVRPSIGIAMWPDHGASAEALLRNADAAMYDAKRRQSGYAFFSQRAGG